MKPITYQAYRTNALIREQLEREVRRARSHAIGRALAMPFKALFRRLQRGRVLVIRAA